MCKLNLSILFLHYLCTNLKLFFMKYGFATVMRKIPEFNQLKKTNPRYSAALKPYNYKTVEELFTLYSKQIKSLGLENFNKSEFLGVETSQLYMNHLMSVFALLIMIIHSSNKVKFKSNEY